MGAGASIGISAAVNACSDADLAAVLNNVPQNCRSKLQMAIAGEGSLGKPVHVVFMLLESNTHIIPILPLMESLIVAKAKVTSFCNLDPEDEKQTEMVNKIKATGSEYVMLKAETDPALEGFEGGEAMFVAYFKYMPDALAQAKALKPTLIAWDPFLGYPCAIAKILKVPGVGVLSFPGPGAFSKPSRAEYENQENAEKTQVFFAWFKEKYGVELLTSAVWFNQFYSTTLNVVPVAETLYLPAKDDFQIERFKECPFKCVGPLVDPRKASCNVGDFPLDKVQEAKSSGKKVVLVAFGTHVLGPLWWDKPFGKPVAANDDGTTVNGKTLQESTAKEFAHFAFRTCIEAFGGLDDFFVVLTIGKQEDVLEGLGMEMPANFLVAKFVPQLKLLPLCSAFISHGGAGSVNEAVLNKIPLIVVPLVGDQPPNADKVAAVKCGFSFRYPYKTLQKEALMNAVTTLTDASSASPYKKALDTVVAEVEEGGGPDNAAKLILALA
eukprot:TRINITY_DN26670_c0_g1_i1.p1 TRINITY_DN26670_c0_g1~~TRINITY_DN26670_c0_g1_i1.p1  ORF type:complete len:496 (-),score=69.18 TRINITY_DN26670_c0_g1_i1:94-1581(-)